MIATLLFVASDIDPIKETVPKESHNLLVPAINIDLAVDKILKIKENKLDKLILTDWAINHFSPEKWINKFYSKL